MRAGIAHSPLQTNGPNASISKLAKSPLKGGAGGRRRLPGPAQCTQVEYLAAGEAGLELGRPYPIAGCALVLSEG